MAEQATTSAGSQKARLRLMKFSAQELEILVTEVVNNYDVLLGPLSTKTPLSSKQAIWEAMLSRINALGVCQRTVEILKKRWADFKRKTKEKLAKHGVSKEQLSPLESLVESTLQPEHLQDTSRIQNGPVLEDIVAHASVRVESAHTAPEVLDIKEEASEIEEFPVNSTEHGSDQDQGSFEFQFVHIKNEEPDMNSVSVEVEDSLTMDPVQQSQPCPYCQYTFTTAHYLEKHLQRRHTVEYMEIVGAQSSSHINPLLHHGQQPAFCPEDGPPTTQQPIRQHTPGYPTTRLSRVPRRAGGVTQRGQPRQRAPSFNWEEKSLLVQEVMTNRKELLGNFLLKPSQKKRKWERIAQKVSALGYHRRTTADIQKRFYDLRREIRTKMAALRCARVMTEGELPPRSPLTEEEQCILTTLDAVAMQGIVGVDTAEPQLTAWREQPPRTPFTQVEPRVLQGLIGIDTADPHLLTASRTAHVLSCEVLPVKEEQTASLSPPASPAQTPSPAPSPPHTHRDTSLIQKCPRAEALHSPTTSPSPPPSPARPACPPGQLAADPSELLVQVIEAQSLSVKPVSQVTKRGKPRQRAPRFNHKENRLLVKEVVNNKKELLGNLVLKPSQRKRKWERIAQKVSALGYHRRRAADIQKRFYDLRRAVRTKMAALRCARVMTEGELPPRSPLTEEEQCILTTLDAVAMQGIVGVDTAEPQLTASSRTAHVLSCEVLPVKEEQTASLSPLASPAQTPSPAPSPPHTQRDTSLIQNCPRAEALHSPTTSPSPPPSPARPACPPGQLAANPSELLVQLLAAQRDGNSGQASIVRILASMKEQQAQQLGVLQSLAEKQSHMVERHEALEQRLGEISTSLNQLVAGLLPTLQLLSSAAQGLHTPLVSQPCPPPAPDC
ncbi:hypothetical protein HHUSO_G23104 [Huso huso]|uniref:C2H2-type domain-containing protein n=1 Tax=Huso huso TaxID=61971 RepID=A0ABR0YVM2_HUSHU